MDPTNNHPQPDPTPEHGYLWDGSGAPDPEIQKLETLLAEFRHNAPAPVLPDFAPRRTWSLFPLRISLFPALLATAAIALIGVITLVVYSRKPSSAVAGWDVSRIGGSPRIGAKAITD